MGTKRIGRVGERDAGFHSNGALPSALSCCHYGSEVFRSCRKQSYGKPACLDSSLSWFIYLFIYVNISPSDWVCSSCWCNVSRVASGSFVVFRQRLLFFCLSVPFFSVLLTFLFLRSDSSWNSPPYFFFVCTATTTLYLSPLHAFECFLWKSRPQSNECSRSFSFLLARFEFLWLCPLLMTSFSKCFAFSSVSSFLLFHSHWSLEKSPPAGLTWSLNLD